MRAAVISILSKALRFAFYSFNAQRASLSSLPLAPRILVVKPCCLGDVLMTTPLVAALRHGFPQAEITYAVGAWSRPVITGNRHIDHVRTIPDRWTLGSLLAVARSVREQRYDLAFVPERTPLSGLLVWLAGIPVRVGLDSQGRGFTYTHPIPISTSAPHEADLYLSLATAIGLEPGERRLWFFPTEADRVMAADILAKNGITAPFLIIHPGGGRNPGMALERKRWAPERWAIVVDTLLAERGMQALIVGDSGETKVSQAVQRAMDASALVITQQWRWGVLAALIEQATLFLGHDTGMSFLANAVGTPHVVVFGPSDPQMYGPYGPAGRAVWKPTPPSPCFYQGAAPMDCPCGGQCMRNVTPADVLKLVDELVGISS